MVFQIPGYTLILPGVYAENEKKELNSGRTLPPVSLVIVGTYRNPAAESVVGFLEDQVEKLRKLDTKKLAFASSLDKRLYSQLKKYSDLCDELESNFSTYRGDLIQLLMRGFPEDLEKTGVHVSQGNVNLLDLAACRPIYTKAALFYRLLDYPKDTLSSIVSTSIEVVEGRVQLQRNLPVYGGTRSEQRKFRELVAGSIQGDMDTSILPDASRRVLYDRAQFAVRRLQHKIKQERSSLQKMLEATDRSQALWAFEDIPRA